MGRLYASDITVSIQRSRCWIAVETVLMAFAKFSDSDPVLSIDENDNSGSSVAALASVAVFNSTSCELMSLRSSSICLALVWTSGSSFCHTLWCLSKCSFNFFGAQSLAFSRCGWYTRLSPQSCDIRAERVCHAFVFRTLDTEVDLRCTVCVDRTC